MSDHTPVVLPWYRHRWPWFLMAGPAIVVVAGVITLWLAIRSNDGLVADDYYKQGLAINQTTARDQQATRLGLQAELMIGGSGREIRVMLRSQTAESLPDSLLLRVMHPTRSVVDQTLVLRRQGAGIYAAQLEQPLAGRWRVSLEDGPRAWRLTGEWQIEKTPTLHLP